MLKIEHLTKHYGESGRGVTDLTLHVQPGQLCAFIGRNGAGKTTTLKAIAGIHDFEAGTISIAGIDLRKDPMGCKRKFAYIPDDPDLFEYLTGIQYLNFVADIFRIPAGERREKIETYADAFGIRDALGELIASYSHGMKQKLALTGGLIHDPELLILDEPFVGLDPQAIFTLKGILQDLCARGGAVFFSTHVLDAAEKLCTHAAMIRDGRLVISGKMEDLLKSGRSLESMFLEVDGHAENADRSGM